MITSNLCGPALIYLTFSLIQIVLDTTKGLYNTALFKFIISFIITTLLNALCIRGLTAASWVIVFIPFITMTVITSILLYYFGLDPARGTINISTKTAINRSNGINQTYEEGLTMLKNTPLPPHPSYKESKLPIGSKVQLKNYPTNIKALCANPNSTGNNRARMNWFGTVCNEDHDVIWDNMTTTTNLASGATPSRCSWNRSGKDNSWITSWIGSCGVAPKNVSGLPMNMAMVTAENNRNK